MKLTASTNPALILIDIQKGFENIEYWGEERNNPSAELRARELLEMWRDLKLPVFHIKHCSNTLTSLLHESNVGNDFNDFVIPSNQEAIIKKSVNSAFIGTNLQSQLDRANINTLCIAGLTTDQCVSSTTRMAGNMGYNTFLVSDASATFNKKGIDGRNYSAELIHQTALASLNNEFAFIVNSDFVKRELFN